MLDKRKNLPHAKSYCSIFDLFKLAPVSSASNKKLRKMKTPTMFQATCGDTLPSNSPFVTAEQCNIMNILPSNSSIGKSTSTLFYDLDDLAKRHSFNCFTEITKSNSNILKIMDLTCQNESSRKSYAIVQECATQHNNKLPHTNKSDEKNYDCKIPAKDSFEVNLTKLNLPNGSLDSPTNCVKEKSIDGNESNKVFINENQKIWSYSKYQTSYEQSTIDNKKDKKKFKRTEDPCPCQLFTYTCPCTKNKSLTELAKNSKIKAVNDQVTSTILEANGGKKKYREFNTKSEIVKESKLTSTSKEKQSEKRDQENSDTKSPIAEKLEELDKAKGSAYGNQVNKNQHKKKPVKKSRTVTCPNCNEKVEIISFTEGEVSIKQDNSLTFRGAEVSAASAYSYRVSSKYDSPRDNDSICPHDPKCEMVPACQFVSAQNVYSLKSVKNKQSKSPRVIRITKACRHHPPCIVVPSCQRANVLKNNCEFIPPCIHRPRCINLPLCVPLSKDLHYDEIQEIVGENRGNGNQNYNYVPEFQNTSITKTINPQINVVSHIPNYDFKYQRPILTSTVQTQYQSLSPNQQHNFCKCTKSCQYECIDCNRIKESVSDAVIFIRDVGCQFRNKNYAAKLSTFAQSVSSSTSLDVNSMRIGNNPCVHTLICEDKCTSPAIQEEISKSTTSRSFSSIDINPTCPAHGNIRSQRSDSSHRGARKPSIIAAFTTQIDPILASYIYPESHVAPEAPIHRDTNAAYSVKSRKSLLKSKYKMFSTRRRKRSHVSVHVLKSSCKKLEQTNKKPTRDQTSTK